MIDLVELILKYGENRGHSYFIEISDNENDLYLSASFNLTQTESGQTHIVMDFYSPIKENSVINDEEVDEPIHECNFLIQNVNLSLFNNNDGCLNFSMCINNCIIDPDLYFYYSNIINCVKREGKND